MKRSAAFLFQCAICLFGFSVLVFLLWEPHVEGRNVHATVFEIYFKDPFLAYVYLGSVPFFLALFGLFRMFGNVRQNNGFSGGSLDALRRIKKCEVVFLFFVAGGAVFIILFGDKEDRPPGLFLSILVVFFSSCFLMGLSKLRKYVEHVLAKCTN